MFCANKFTQHLSEKDISALISDNQMLATLVD
jgi:hypothetical protein